MLARAVLLLVPLAGLLALPAPVSSQAKKPAEVKVASIQASSDLGDVKANTRKFTALVEEAAKNGARIIVLPEAAITGYLSQDLETNWHLPGKPLAKAFTGKSPARYAEMVPGPSTKHFAALAKKLGVYLTVPFLEVVQPAKGEKGGPRYFNTVVLVSPTGEVVAHYRKLTPWPHPEQSWATPGDRGVQTYDTEYGRVGLAICYDIHTILERYAKLELWALLYPIAWVDTEHPSEWFWHRLPARVRKYNHFVIGANWSVDERQKWRGYGFTTIIGPDGKVVATARSLYGSEIVYATIPTGR